MALQITSHLTLGGFCLPKFVLVVLTVYGFNKTTTEARNHASLALSLKLWLSCIWWANCNKLLVSCKCHRVSCFFVVPSQTEDVRGQNRNDLCGMHVVHGMHKSNFRASKLLFLSKPPDLRGWCWLMDAFATATEFLAPDKNFRPCRGEHNLCI